MWIKGLKVYLHGSVKWFCWLFFVLWMQSVFGLGLGTIELSSHLNEPLRATVEIFEVRGLSAQEVLVGLAAKEDFEKQGIERFYFLSQLRFKVNILPGADKGSIEITTAKVVREPFLNFLIEVNWPTGRLLREYTLLLDPPVVSDVTAPAVKKAQVKKTTPATKRSEAAIKKSGQSASSDVSKRPSSVAPTISKLPQKQEYKTKTGDSVWKIARKEMRTDSQTTIQQRMVAIQRANPSAFLGSNMNALKKGQVLRLPDTDEVRSVPAGDALTEVAKQNAQWLASLSGRKELAIDQKSDQTAAIPIGGGEKKTEKPKAEDDTQGQLRLVAATHNKTASSNEGQNIAASGRATDEATPSSSASLEQKQLNKELEEKLAVAEEQIDKSDLQIQDLQSRVEELSTQVETSDRLLSLKNDQIAALQARLKSLEKMLAENESGSIAEGEEVGGLSGSILAQNKTGLDATDAVSKDEATEGTIDGDLAASLIASKDSGEPGGGGGKLPDGQDLPGLGEDTPQQISDSKTALDLLNSLDQKSPQADQANTNQLDNENVENEVLLNQGTEAGSRFKQSPNMLLFLFLGVVFAILVIILLVKRSKKKSDSSFSVAHNYFSSEDSGSAETELLQEDASNNSAIDAKSGRSIESEFDQDKTVLQQDANEESIIQQLEANENLRAKQSEARLSEVKEDEGEHDTVLLDEEVSQGKEESAEDEVEFDIDFQLDSNDEVEDHQATETLDDLEKGISSDEEELDIEESLVTEDIPETVVGGLDAMEAENTLEEEIQSEDFSEVAEDESIEDISLELEEEENIELDQLTPETTVEDLSGDAEIDEEEAASIALELTDEDDKENAAGELEESSSTTATVDTAEAGEEKEALNLDAAAEGASEENEEWSFDANKDATETKLNLASAYLDMGDPELAREILDEVINEGNQEQKEMAKALLARAVS